MFKNRTPGMSDKKLAEIDIHLTNGSPEHRLETALLHEPEVRAEVESREHRRAAAEREFQAGESRRTGKPVSASVAVRAPELDKGKLCGEKGEAELLFEDDRRAFEDECERKIQDVIGVARRQSLDELSRAMLSLDFSRKAPQSCVYQAVARALSEPPSVVPIVVTDLKHEACPYEKPRIEPLFGAAGGARPVVVVVPSTADPDPIAAMEERMDDMRKRAPGVRVIPYTRIASLFAE